MILLNILALYYVWYSYVYGKASFDYATGNATAIAEGYTTFPVMAARHYTPKKQALRLAQVCILTSATAISLWFYPWVGILLAGYISGYEVYMSWGFYRRGGTVTTNEGMTRFTLHAALCGMLIALAVVRWIG